MQKWSGHYSAPLKLPVMYSIYTRARSSPKSSIAAVSGLVLPILQLREFKSAHVGYELFSTSFPQTKRFEPLATLSLFLWHVF